MFGDVAARCNELAGVGGRQCGQLFRVRCRGSRREAGVEEGGRGSADDQVDEGAAEQSRRAGAVSRRRGGESADQGVAERA